MSLANEVALGLYVGVLTGTFTAFLAFALAFGFRYVAGVKLSDRLGLMIGLAAAGLQGGFIGLVRDPEMLRSPTLAAALLSVMMITMYAHGKGRGLADALPRGSVTKLLWQRTLSSDAAERIGRFGRVRVRVQGEVGDVAGYPPLADRLRAEIAGGEWEFPADLPLSELESRLIDRLETDYELPVVQVSIDTDGRATIAAAPPSGALSRRVPPDQRAVSIEARLPSGLARRDEVELTVEPASDEGRADGTADPTPEAGDTIRGSDETEVSDAPPTVRVRGTVVSVTPAGFEEDESDETATKENAGTAMTTPANGAAGGQGRVTIAVDSDDVATVVTGTVRGLLVRSKGGDAAFELVSLLRRQDNRFRKITVRAASGAVETPLADLDTREQFGVDVLAIRRAGEWQFTPSSQARLQAGDELFAAGPREGLDALAEVSA
jgi:hypothetical protein